MKPRITVMTLGVDDLDRALAFYRDGLGLPSKGIAGREFEYGAVAFFELQGGLILALWPRTSIARDTGLPRQPGSPTDWGGYAGYFQDPDGHLWEVAWNPKLLPQD